MAETTWKAKSVALATDDSIMFTPAPEPRRPTTFFTFPRELRQKILYHSCSVEYTVSGEPEDKGLAEMNGRWNQKVYANDERGRSKL